MDGATTALPARTEDAATAPTANTTHAWKWTEARVRVSSQSSEWVLLTRRAPRPPPSPPAVDRAARAKAKAEAAALRGSLERFPYQRQHSGTGAGAAAHVNHGLRRPRTAAQHRRRRPPPALPLAVELLHLQGTAQVQSKRHAPSTLTEHTVWGMRSATAGDQPVGGCSAAALLAQVDPSARALGGYDAASRTWRCDAASAAVLQRPRADALRAVAVLRWRAPRGLVRALRRWRGATHRCRAAAVRVVEARVAGAEHLPQRLRPAAYGGRRSRKRAEDAENEAPAVTVSLDMIYGDVQIGPAGCKTRIVAGGAAAVSADGAARWDAAAASGTAVVRPGLAKPMVLVTIARAGVREAVATAAVALADDDDHHEAWFSLTAPDGSHVREGDAWSRSTRVEVHWRAGRVGVDVPAPANGPALAAAVPTAAAPERWVHEPNDEIPGLPPYKRVPKAVAADKRRQQTAAKLFAKYSKNPPGTATSALRARKGRTRRLFDAWRRYIKLKKYGEASELLRALPGVPPAEDGYAAVQYPEKVSIRPPRY